MKSVLEDAGLRTNHEMFSVLKFPFWSLIWNLGIKKFKESMLFKEKINFYFKHMIWCINKGQCNADTILKTCMLDCMELMYFRITMDNMDNNENKNKR